MAAFDVTQEVSLLKTCPQLPVSVPHSQAVRGEEVTSGYTTATSKVISDSSQIPEHEDEPLKHVEEYLRQNGDRHEDREEDSGEEEKELSEEEIGEYTSPLDSTQSLTPSPPHPNSLAAMSRIYNLETVGSRTGVCLRERTVDIPSVHLVKVKPFISNTQQGDKKAVTGEDNCGVQTIQRQIEQFQLKEQEALNSYASPNTSLKAKETKGQQNLRGLLKYQVKDDAKTQVKDQERPESNSKLSPQGVCSPTSQPKQNITIKPSFLMSQSPDNSVKPSDCTPTPAPSPSSASPAQSPSISPSPTPSPPLFTIRSASGGQVKRGATITVTPRKPAAGRGGVTGSTAASTAAGSTPAKTTLQQAQTTPVVTDPVKKRYPTVEEIEVIGGYQNLEKSCLVKNTGTPKKMRVCFDEDQLEQVCEYPSETSMLAGTPYPHDVGRVEKLQGEEAQDEDAEEEESTLSVMSRGTRIAGIATGRGLRVDESCPR
ncbi:taperin isoform X2 [Mastacembelus armatus]|uniref:taperin isoform X2 n=1 Tax=Mastacembelus armatus TaxID=205130 RepID=UPI000E45D918|nr:phostensin isoform X2 [Mastacembelus armatus]